MKNALLGRIAILFLSSAGIGGALQIREYDSARHDRLTGFPSAPAENPGFLYDASRFRGIGWDTANTKREVALVSPVHFVCASHFAPAIGATIRFLDASGAIVERTVASTTIIKDGDGTASDVTLGTLNSPIDSATGVLAFRYLNLASESDYTNKALMVFGWYAQAGYGKIAGFADMDVAGRTTRTLKFQYRDFGSTTSDDAKLEGGDSGSPCFVDTDGQPALVATHSMIAISNFVQNNYSAFVPHYIAGLDAALAPDGRRMRPANYGATTMSASFARNPSTLRRSNTGQISVAVSNSGANEAGNVELLFAFPAGHGPDSASATGWIVEHRSADVWSVRKALMASGESATVTLDWSALPDAPSLGGTLALTTDTAPQVDLDIDPELLPSFAEWAGGLSDPTPGGDPDSDTIPNLEEYGFGGDPEVWGTLIAGTSHPLLPRIEHTDAATIALSFPRRTDATLRGLSYLVEWSDSLAADSWSSTPPPGLDASTEAWDPPVAGFERVPRLVPDSGRRGGRAGRRAQQGQGGGERERRCRQHRNHPATTADNGRPCGEQALDAFFEPPGPGHGHGGKRLAGGIREVAKQAGVVGRRNSGGEHPGVGIELALGL